MGIEDELTIHTYPWVTTDAQELLDRVRAAKREGAEDMWKRCEFLVRFNLEDKVALLKKIRALPLPGDEPAPVNLET